MNMRSAIRLAPSYQALILVCFVCRSLSLSSADEARTLSERGDDFLSATEKAETTRGQEQAPQWKNSWASALRGWATGTIDTALSDRPISKPATDAFSTLETTVGSSVPESTADMPLMQAPMPRVHPAPISMLRNARPSDVVLEPYPHLVIRNAVEPKLYRQLSNSFPVNGLFRQYANGGKALLSNTRYDINANKVRINSKIPKVWKQFVAYHSSPRFFQEVGQLFEKGVMKVRPDLVSKRGLSTTRFSNFSTGVRGAPMPKKDSSNVTIPQPDMLLDCQIGINSPVLHRSTSVRGPHVDNIAEVYAGLLYMRAPGDKTKGGDLDVFKCKSPCKMMPGLTNAKANKAEFADKDIKSMRRVAYSENTLVIFINSMISVHAVTPRPPTHFSRRLVNIVGVLNCRKTACGKGEQRRARRSGVRKGG